MNRYFVQHLDEPFYRTRIGMTQNASAAWQDDFSFFAFDLPVPGTVRRGSRFLIARPCPLAPCLTLAESTEHDS